MVEFVITTAITPKRDVDLFGVTTVMVQAKRDPASSGVPVLYVSPYVSDPMVFAQRCADALAWLDGETTVSPPARAGAAPNKPAPEAAAPVASPSAAYAMPEFVEDVDYSERLPLSDPMSLDDWKAWAAAMSRRVELAQDSLQLAALSAANDYGMKFCPPQLMATVRKALNDAYAVTYNQAAAA
ncbi:MAG: hypothetical protein DI624_04145 [Brevundimonas sp.]|uniref:hypothetical protein n=1 Tax=Brevundimonas sp. TaxID=1871086 RepID=UPI000DB65834|nr:hypothetical protein [Brevundimonas sp.]PZT99871.1 MAG: hypothetical protein DI624_04145 [Brevundimonas sp.]